MFVKAVKPGMYDLAKTGGFVTVVVGTVFQIPDSIELPHGSWLVRCDEAGNITDPDAVRAHAANMRAKAARDRDLAKIEADKAKRSDAEADAAEARVKALEAAIAEEDAKAKEAERKSKPVK